MSERRRIEPGTRVTWTSTSGGSSKTKTGTVVAFVEAKRTVPWNKSREPWQTHPLAGDATGCKTGADISIHDRYLVRVEVPPRSIHLYAPRASVVEEQNP